MDCSAIDDLSPLQKLSWLRRLTLQNLKPSHKLDWLADSTSNLDTATTSFKFSIVGPPVELGTSSFNIRLRGNLYQLKLPEGSQVTPEFRDQIPFAWIKFGDWRKKESWYGDKQ